MCTFFKQTGRLLTIILVCILAAVNSHATHYAAVDLYVEYIGTGPSDLTYRITLMTYKACEPNNASLGPETINWGSVNGSFTSSFYMADVPNDTLDQLCPNFKPVNSCRVPTSIYPGFVRKIFRHTVTLPSRQTDWRFWWTSGARNGGIVNLQNPQGNIYVEAGLDNVFRYDNNTPQFLVDPLPYICQNQPASYLNGPFDLNGDSLETINHAPYNTATVQYNYVAVTGQPYYNLANPIGSTTANPYTVNQFTGSATFTPQNTGLFVLAFRCNKYDKKTGKLIGYIMRDVQVSVLNCNSAAPEFDKTPQNTIKASGVVNQDGSTTVTVCTGQEAQFSFSAKSQAASNNVYIDANNATIPGSIVSVSNNGTSQPTATFIWTPHYGNIGDHILILTAKDSTCGVTQPIVLKSYKVVLIKVIASLFAGPDKKICLEGGHPVELYVQGAEDVAVQWTGIDGGAPQDLSATNTHNPMANPKATTSYVISTTDIPSFCKNKDTIAVVIDESVKVNVFPDNPIILCRPDYLQLDATLDGKGPITPISCGTSSVSAATTGGQIAVNGTLDGSYDTLGPLTPSFPNAVRSVKQQYLIRKSEMFQSGFLYGTIKGLSFEAINPADPTYEYSNFRISMKCTDETSVSRLTGFQSGVTPVFVAPAPVSIANGWNDFVLDNAYSWDTSKNLLIEICYSNNATTAVPGNDPIIRFVPTTYTSSIRYSDAASNNVCGILTSTTIVQYFSRPQFKFDFYETVPQPVPFNWYPSVFLSDSTIQQPLAYIPRSTKYYVEAKGRSGCILRDSADIYVPVHDYQILPVDSNICFGETAPMRVAKGGFTYKWYKINDKGQYEILSNTKESTCWDCGNPVLSPEKTTTYKVAVYDSVWCIDTLTHVITVMPLPDIRILNKDTVVKYGQSIQLLASGARMYNWTPVASLNNANVSYPVATPTEPTEFIAAGIGTNGCIARDTLKVAIDYRDNLFIPSGFSPNGDGKNDVFKVSNLTFQRIVEFRVFNRWGQEIFNANDNSGWDGAWKGEPQDMGTYTYQIRIGFPDGYIESYKGVVTIIR